MTITATVSGGTVITDTVVVLVLNAQGVPVKKLGTLSPVQAGSTTYAGRFQITSPRTGAIPLVVTAASQGSVTLAQSPVFSLRVRPAPVYPLKLSSTGRYLVDQQNTPFFMVGEDAWSLITQLSNGQVERYLSDRASRGFNTIWVGAADNIYQANPPYNYYGNAPFDGPDFTNEDSAYWSHVDYVLQRAAAYGITVMLDPGFVGIDASGGYYNSYQNSSDAVMTAYGTWLGTRYRNQPNLIWVLGGDWDPSNSNISGKIADLGVALQAADPNHLITAEAIRGESSLDALAGPPSWLGLNWVYLVPTSIPTGAASNYSRFPWLPPLMGEDWYEGEHSMTDFQVRQEGYWAILSGTYLGRIFGNYAIWAFSAPQITTDPWQNQLGSPGSVSQSILGDLFYSREHWLLVPDINHTVLTGGYEWGPTLSVAARTSDGQSVIAYLSDGNATAKTVDMSQVTDPGSQAKCWWYNPQTGAATLIGVFPTQGARTFTAPDGNDWVLIIDSLAANLPAPGAAALR
ncbi:MAG TPA: DUF4038 domain-containing protein [Bryobacteraceae bacterium]|nr:DUF4038 domain-containing protein [Bryobacteraceae bacterium]